LQLAECFEEADWAAGERMIRQISLDGGKVKASFQKAIAWANLATMLPEDDQPQ
jgi:hypothetical protein